jgi:hypothetical protein
MSIEQIKIVIKTSIPGKAPFELKSNMIYIPNLKEPLKQLNDYPFITALNVFNKNAIQKHAYDYDYSKIVKFFFNKKVFVRLLSKFTIPNPEPPNKTSREILIENVKIMLELLFPMSFPATLNVTNSFDLYIKHIEFDLNDAFSNVSKDFFKRITAVTSSPQTKNFSYLKLDGNVYTVTKVIWLNDLLNHPVYRDFINEFIGFTQLASEQKVSLETNIKDKTNILFNRIQYDKTNKNTRNSLNIYYGYIEKFVDNIIANTLVQNSYDSQKSEKFISGLKQIIILLIKLADLHITFTLDLKGTANTPTRIEDSIKQVDEIFLIVVKLVKAEKDVKRFPADADLKNKLDDAKNEYTTLSNFKIKNINTKTIGVNYLSDLTILINDIFDIYNRLKDGNTGTLTGIPPEFSARLNNIKNEIKSITIQEIIKEKYLSDDANINLEGEDPDVVTELTKSFPTYITFSNKIKELLPSNRFTTNDNLQTKIVEYSKGNTSNNDDSFDKIMKAIQDQFILMNNNKKTTDFDDQQIQSLLNTEINVLDKRKQDAPHYEIYVALNLIEGEIKSDNLNNIKCIYRGMYLGKEMQNYFTKYNKYDIDQHLFYLSQKTIKNEKLNESLLVQNTDNKLLPPPPPTTELPPSPPPPATTGGNKKNYIKTRKLHYKRRSTTLRK